MKVLISRNEHLSHLYRHLFILKENKNIFEDILWGDTYVKNEYNKLRSEIPIRFFIIENNKIIAYWQFIEERTFFMFRFLKSGWISGGGGYPIILSELSQEKFNNTVNFLINSINNYCKRNFIIKLEIYGDPSEEKSYKKFFESKNFSKSLFGTIIIELEDEESIFRKFHGKTRNSVRKAQKSELTFNSVKNKKEFQKYYSVYFQTGIQSNFITKSENYLFNIWKKLSNNAKIYYISKNNEILATAFIYIFKENAWLINLGNTEKGRQLQAGNLLQYEMMKVFVKSGIKRYNLNGISLKVDNEKLAGINKFKERLGGKKIFYNQFTIEFNYILILIYQQLVVLLKIILSLRKIIVKPLSNN